MSILFKIKAMKNSRLFLILALSLMSISAVASFNGIKNVVSAFYYKKGAVCVHVNKSIACSPSDFADCVYLDQATAVVYPCYADAACTLALGRD